MGNRACALVIVSCQMASKLLKVYSERIQEET